MYHRPGLSKCLWSFWLARDAQKQHPCCVKACSLCPPCFGFEATSHACLSHFRRACSTFMYFNTSRLQHLHFLPFSALLAVLSSIFLLLLFHVRRCGWRRSVTCSHCGAGGPRNCCCGCFFGISPPLGIFGISRGHGSPRLHLWSWWGG